MGCARWRRENYLDIHLGVMDSEWAGAKRGGGKAGITFVVEYEVVVAESIILQELLTPALALTSHLGCLMDNVMDIGIGATMKF